MYTPNVEKCRFVQKVSFLDSPSLADADDNSIPDDATFDSDGRAGFGWIYELHKTNGKDFDSCYLYFMTKIPTFNWPRIPADIELALWVTYIVLHYPDVANIIFEDASQPSSKPPFWTFWMQKWRSDKCASDGPQQRHGPYLERGHGNYKWRMIITQPQIHHTEKILGNCHPCDNLCDQRKIIGPTEEAVREAFQNAGKGCCRICGPTRPRRLGCDHHGGNEVGQYEESGCLQGWAHPDNHILEKHDDAPYLEFQEEMLFIL